jgi:hypothetical protein
LINDIKSEDKLNTDPTGEETIEFLMNSRKIVRIISGNHPSSLGLHPAVYFYSPQGRYQSTSLLAVVQLVKDFQKRKYFGTFIRERREFEDFIMKYKDFIQQINNKHRIGMRGYMPIKELYQFIIEELERGCDEDDILKSIKADRRFSYLKADNIYTPDTEKKEFSRETKSEAFLREALKSPIRCKICGGLMHRNSITVDHIERKEDGGLGNIDNAQLAHPYCNTTVKN